MPLGPAASSPDADEIVTLPLTGDWVQQPGFNANGIAETPDHQALLVIQSATATLFRVDPATGEATTVDLGGTAPERRRPPRGSAARSTWCRTSRTPSRSSAWLPTARAAPSSTS